MPFDCIPEEPERGARRGLWPIAVILVAIWTLFGILIVQCWRLVVP